MAHVCQELRLQARRRQRRITRPLELGLDACPLGDVARVEHQAANAGLVEEIGPDVLDMPPRAIAVQETPREWLGHSRAFGRREYERACARRVVRMNEIDERPSDDGGRLVAEEPLNRGADVAHDRVALEHDDEIRRVPDERDESFLCPACGLLRAVPFASRSDLTEDGERGERDRAEDEATERLGPDLLDDADEQPIANHESGVRQEAEGCGLVPRGGRLGRSAATEILRAGDDEDVASDPHGAQPATVARRSMEAQITVDEVADEERQEAGGDEGERTTARLLRPAQ